MRKYVIFGNTNDVVVQLMEMVGYEVQKDLYTDPFNALRFMMKTVIVFGDCNLDHLQAILSRVKTLVYIGGNREVKDMILRHVEEKDIPLKIEQNSMVVNVSVHYNNRSSFEVYYSNAFTELELSAKYLLNLGPKLTLMMRYISQYEMKRNTLPFDHSDISALFPLYDAFTRYRVTECSLGDKLMDQDVLLQIFNDHKP